MTSANGVPILVHDSILPRQHDAHERDYILRAGGSTWELTCTWQPASQALMARLCEHSADSLKLSR